MRKKSTYLLTLLLTALFLLPWSGNVWAETLTVADGTQYTNGQYVPMYGNYDDAYQHVQVLYPSSLLSNMNGKQISSLTFYLKTKAGKAFKSTYAIRLEEVDDTYVPTSYIATTTSAKYTGLLDAQGETMVISFTPFTYNGGNLLFDLTSTNVVSNGYSNTYFYGVNQNANLSTQAYNNSSVPTSGTERYFLPKTTFTYEEPANPNCADVAGLTKGEVTATTAAFSWTDATVEEWQYVCLPAATALDWSSESVQTTTSNSASITGLSGSTEYKFYVRANCGSANGNSRASSVAFKTPCGAKSIPYEYGFEDVTYSYGVYTLPECWEASPSGGNYPSVYGYNAKAGTNCLVMKGSSASLAIMPQMAQALNTLSISFFYYNIYQQTGSGQLEIGYITNNDPTTYQKIGDSFEKRSSYATDATEVTLSGVPSTATNLAFKYPGSSYSSMDGIYLDAITVSVAAACAKPTGLTVSSTTPEGAELIWDGAADDYQYGVVAKDAAAPTSWTDLVSAKTVTITGKAAGTAYDFYVRANCGSSQSDPVKTSFTPVCPAPTAPAVSAITTTTATASWTAAAGVEDYQYIVVEAGADTTGHWASATLVDNAITANLTSLTAGTKYDFYVRSKYSATSVSSSAKVTFTTECEAVSTLPWNEGFEDYSAGSTLSPVVPDCWKVLNANSSYPYIYVTSSSTYCKTGSRGLYFYTGENAGYAILPKFSADLNTLQIQFSHKEYNASNPVLTLGYLTDITDASTFQVIKQFTSSASWADEKESLASIPAGVAGTARLAFRITGSAYYFSGLDDITVSVLPACAEPTGLTKDATTPDGATFTWSGDAANYQYAVVAKDAAAPTVWTDLEGLKTVTVSGKTAGTAYDFYVRSNCGSSQSSAVKASFTPVCPAPTAPAVSAIATTTATASWTAAAGIENYQYIVVESGEAEDWTSPQSANTNSASLTGLSASTTYDFYVRSYYSATSVSSSVKKTFTTECAAITGDGWSQNFDEETAYPACWKKIGTSYPAFTTSSYYVRSGKGIYFYGGTSSKQIAILPKFTEIANQSKTLQITLWYSNYSSSYTGTNYASPQVGWITDPADANTFHAVETLEKVASWTEATIELPGAPSNAYVAICYGGGSSEGMLLVDDISISEAPSCMKPTGVSGSATAYNEASISWTANGSESAWKLQYSSDGGENWSDEIAVVSGDLDGEGKYALTGLSGNTSYIVRVKADCGGDEYSEWSANSAAFPTPCGPADASNFSETFESTTAGSGNLPACWEYSESYTSWGTTYPYVYNSSSSAYAGNKSLYFYGGTSSSQQAVLLPTMNATLDGLTIEFYYQAASSTFSTMAKFVLGYIAANDEFTAVETLDYAESYTLYKKALSSVPNTAKNIAIRFTGSASSASTGFIDNVKVYPTPSCVEPTGVAGANMTANSAEISWTSDASTWNVQYSTDGSNWNDVMDGENVAEITSNPYTLTGLSANTLYYARVKAICGGANGESEWSDASAAFRTECAEITSSTWSEDFSSAASEEVPPCWSVIVTDAEYPKIYASTSSSHYHTASPGLLINNKHLKYGLAVFPEIANLNTLQVSFWHKEESALASNCGNLELGYLTDATDSTTFNLIKACDLTSSWAQVTDVNLSSVPSGARLAFRYIGKSTSWEYYTAVDDIEFSVAPTCPAPKSVLVSNITAHSAQVAWTNGKNETAWALQTSEDGTNWGAEIPADANPFTLTDLEANATYYVRVKAVCTAEDNSEWSVASAAFNTPCEAKALGWSENFDDASALPECWEATATGSSGNQWGIDNWDEYHSQYYSARYNGRTSSSNSADLITPPIAITTNDAVLGFWYKNAVTAEVYINDGTTTTKLWDITSASNWTEKIIDLSSYNGKTVKFIFRGHGYSTSSSKYLYIDDVRVVRNLTFADDDEYNDTKLAAVNGQTVDVTIGRTFIREDYDSNQDHYNTICLPFDLSAAELAASPIASNDLWAFKYAKVENDELLFRIEEVDHIEAGKPYFIGFEAGDNIVNPLFKNVTIKASVGKKVGDESVAQLCGILEPEPFAKGDQTKLFLYTQTNTLYWWNGSNDSYLNGFRAYFKVPTSGADAPARHGMRARIIKQEEAATGINNTNVENVTLKFIENNQVVIIRNGVKYNIQGQIISK